MINQPIQNHKLKKNITILALAGVVIALVFLNIQSCGKLADKTRLYEASADTLKTIKNEKGQYESTIAILTGTVADFKNTNAGKDSTIKRLQQIVDRHSISATVHGTFTGNTVNSGSTITKYDTVIENDTVFVFPTYSTNWKNQWEDFLITASKDSFHLEYKVFNRFEYSVRNNREKWYKARVPEVTATNINPHTQTVELKNFTVKAPKGQKILVFLGGCIVGTAATIATGYTVKTLIR